MDFFEAKIVVGTGMKYKRATTPKYKLVKGAFYRYSTLFQTQMSPIYVEKQFPIYVEKQGSLELNGHLELANGQLLFSLNDCVYISVPEDFIGEQWEGLLFNCLLGDRAVFVWLGWRLEQNSLQCFRLVESSD
jgi:hypothetical protein